MAQSIFIVAALIIAAGIVLTIILPLMRSGRSARVTNSAEYDLVVFHDQLEEFVGSRGRLPGMFDLTRKQWLRFKKWLPPINKRSSGLWSNAWLIEWIKIQTT